MSSLERIDHIVVLMMENRSFDSVLGWLYEGDRTPKHVTPAVSNARPNYDRPFNGLDGVELADFVNRAELHGKSFAVPPRRGATASNVPDISPMEYFHDVNEQLYGNRAAPPDGKEAPMTGFLENFAVAMREHASGVTGLSKEEQLERFEQVMDTYTPAQLPTLSGLARSYALSDLWFASVPTQTNVNRAFLICGTSLGGVNNAFHAPPHIHTEWLRKKLQFDCYQARTIFNVLEEHEIGWGVFYHDNFPPLHSGCFTRNAYSGLEEIPNVDEHFHDMDEFGRQARLGELPAFSYIEPSWGFGFTDDDPMAQRMMAQKGNDFHPPRNMKLGENLIQSVYNSLSANRQAWEKTLFVVTFDEHVGAFDHVSPPWGAIPPWGDEQPPCELEFDFPFNRFGVRVGTLLISPWIDENVVFRSESDVPFDHTSIAATVLRRFNIPAEEMLGERMANAPTFEKVINRREPRADLFGARSVADGEPLHTGDQFLLRNQRTGDYLTTTPTNALWMRASARYRPAGNPLLGNTGRAPFSFFLGIEEGPILNNGLVQIAANQMSLEESFVIAGVRDEPQCVYDVRRYRDSALQDWRIRRVSSDSASDDSPVLCGDLVQFENALDGPLCQHDRFLNSEPGRPADTWRIESCQAPSTEGETLLYGDRVHLQCVTSGDFVTVVESGTQFYPTMANVGPVELEIIGGQGEVAEDAVFQLRTTEQLVQGHDLLGAWLVPWCYYYANYDRAKQSWFAKRLSGDDSTPLRRGESLILVNESWRQNLAPREGYLTTQRTDKDVWRFV